MDQTQEPSLSNPSSEKFKINKQTVKEFKGRYPTGIKTKVILFNKKQKAIKKKELIRVRKVAREKEWGGKISPERREKNALIMQNRLDAFLEEFLKNGGNATDAAAAVFNVTSRSSASVVGSAYLKKAKQLGRVYLEQKGYTYGRLLTIAAQKAEMSRQPDWWDRVMEIADYGNFRTAKGGAPQTTNINIVNTEKELFKKYALTDGEIIEDTPGGDEIEESEGEEPENAD